VATSCDQATLEQRHSQFLTIPLSKGKFEIFKSVLTSNLSCDIKLGKYLAREYENKKSLADLFLDTKG
jgi:hypothetical protein